MAGNDDLEILAAPGALGREVDDPLGVGDSDAES